MKNPRMDAYAAGLVDGEGCITAKSTKSETAMGIRVLIGMATKANGLLAKIQREYGGTLITQTPANPKHSDITTWTVTGAEAATFLRRIEPHLILKPEQARLALRIEEIRTSQQQIGNRDHYRWTPESMDRCRVIYRRLMELNERGSSSATLIPPQGGTEIARLVAGQWVTDQSDMFSDLGWEPFSGTWPRSGCMSDGRAFELPTSARHTIANASSSSSLLPTPMTSYSARSPEEWRAQRPAGNGATRDKIGDLEVLVRDIDSKMLPTPTASDADKARDNPAQANRKSPPISAVSQYFPTPRTTDATNSMTAPSAMKHVADGYGSLPEVIGAKVLPSPKASDATGGGQHPDKRKGHTQQLVDAVLGLTGAPTLPLFGMEGE